VRVTFDWADTVKRLRDINRVPSALANAELLNGARERWSGRVIPRTSMHDLLFTRPGDEYPFARTVRVASESEAFRFELRAGFPSVLVTADRATREKAPVVLDAFLLQLVGDPDEASS